MIQPQGRATDLHEPPLVPALAREIVAVVHVAGLGAVSRLNVAANVHLAHLGSSSSGQWANQRNNDGCPSSKRGGPTINGTRASPIAALQNRLYRRPNDGDDVLTNGHAPIHHRAPGGWRRTWA
jgi:hypothetical protein